MARYPSGKGEVCKTFMRRFDPGPRLDGLREKALHRRTVNEVDNVFRVRTAEFEGWKALYWIYF